MKNTTIIYGLVSTRDLKNIRYIGKTIQKMNRRLYGHLFDCKRETTHKANWINKEIKEGYKIKIIKIDEVWSNDWSFWEIYWVAEYKRRGYKLTNIDLGGYQSDNMIEIIALTIKGEYIERFNSIGAASRFFNLNEKRIADNVRGVHNYYKNNIFIKASDYNLLKDYSIDKTKHPYKYKKVYQFNLKGDFIKEWNSSQEISDTLMIPKGAISSVITNRQKSTRGYIFSLKRAGVSIPDSKTCKHIIAAYNI